MEFAAVDGQIKSALGGLSHPNGLGRQMAIMVVTGLFLGSRKMASGRVAGPGLLALVTLYFTDSRTAMLATAAAAALLCLQTVAARGLLGKARRPPRCSAMALGIAATVRGGAPTEDALAALSRSGDADEMYSLSGARRSGRYCRRADRRLARGRLRLRLLPLPLMPVRRVSHQPCTISC